MKLPEIKYGGTESLGRYRSNTANIIEKTGQVTGQGILSAGQREARAIGQSGSIMGKAITEAGTMVARGTAKAEIDATNVAKRDIMARNKMESDADLSMKQAALGAATSLAKTGVNLWVQHEQEEQRQQKFDAGMAIDQGMMEKQTEWAQKEEFFATELPESYTGPRVDGDGNPLKVPTSTALPALYKDENTKLIQQHAAGIADKGERESFVQNATYAMDKKYFQLSEVALKSQRAENKKSQGLQITNMVDAGRYQQAKKAVAVSSFTTEEKAKQNHIIDKGQEVADLGQTHLSKSVTGMTGAIEELSSEDYKGKLGPLERMSWVGKMESELNSLAVQHTGKTTANKQLVTGAVNDFTKLATSGEPIDVAKAGQVLLQAKAVGVNPVTIEKLSYALQSQPKVAELNQSPIEQRAGIVEAFKANADTPAKALFAMEIEKQNDKIAKALETDPLKHASDVGVIPTLAPLEADNPEFWVGRQQSQIMTENQFGVASPLLTKHEAVQLSNNFSNMGVQDQVAAIGVWDKSLGEDGMQELMEQISLDIPSLPMIPNLEGPVAASVLKGAKVRNENPSMVPSRQDMQPHFEKLLGNFGLGDARMRKAGEEMVTNLYLAEAEKQGWFDNKDIRTPDSFENTMMEKISGTGDKVDLGLISYGDDMIMAPEKGMTAEGFEKWVDNASPINLIGDRAMGITAHEAMLGVRDGRFNLKQVGKTEFVMFDEDLQMYVPAKEGGALIINYSSTPTPNIDMEVKGAEQAQGGQ